MGGPSASDIRAGHSVSRISEERHAGEEQLLLFVGGVQGDEYTVEY
jgi:hypothetical protein